MRRIVFVAGCAVTSLLPLMAFAATGNALDTAADAWVNIERENFSEHQIDEESAHIESSAELFPANQSSGSIGTIDQQRENRTSDFISATVDGKTVTFRDVPRDEWFAPYVRDIAEKGIVSGYRDAEGSALGLFGPADNLTIEQLSKVALASSSNLGDCPSTPPLNITSSGTWSAGYIACAEKLQWTIYADGSADVHRNASRVEVVVTLLEAFKATINQPTGSGSIFTDVTPSTLFNGVIEQAKKDGIVSGYTDAEGNLTGLFGPNDPVTRAELSKMVTLAMHMYVKQ